MADTLYLTGRKLRAANIELAQGRIWEAYLTYTDVLENDAPGHPYALLNRSLALILIGQPALASFDCWRAILVGKWAEKKVEEEDGAVGTEGNFLGTYITRYVGMCMYALACGDSWTHACANGEVPGEDGRWLAHPLAILGVQKNWNVTSKRLKDDFPHARWIILSGHYRLAYALFKCGGGALQSALNMINLATENWCVTRTQKNMFKDLHNHILKYVETEFQKDEAYMRELHVQGVIRLPRDRDMMEDNLFRGLMKSTYTTIPREQYFWDNLSATTDNFLELSCELEQYVNEGAPDTRLGAILSSHEHPDVKGKAPYMFLVAYRQKEDQHPVMFNDDKGLFVWSRRTGEDIQCEGCGSLLNIDGDWIPAPRPTAPTGITTPTMETHKELSSSGNNSPSPAEPSTTETHRELSSSDNNTPSPSEPERPRFEGPNRPEEDDPMKILHDYARAKYEEDHQASGDKIQSPEEVRKDSIYPQIDDDSRPVCPPSPRPKPRALPPSPPSHRHAPQDPEETTDTEQSRPPSIPRLRKEMAEMGNEPESDLRTCLGVQCSVLFCSQECERRHAAAHDSICDLGIDGTLPSITTEEYAKIGGWWGGMVPTIPRQRVQTLMMQKVLSKLWTECGCEKDLGEGGREVFGQNPGEIPLEVPWVRLLDGNLDEKTPLPQPDEETGMHFENDLPDGDVQFLFPGYKNGSAKPSVEDYARFKSHKMPFSLDSSVIWPLQVLYNMGGFSTVFDIKRWDGWMLMTLMAKVDAATRIDHFIRFAKIIDADGMIKETRCIDLPPMVRLHGFQKLQFGTHDPSPHHFTDPKLANEVELLVGSLHPVANLVRVAIPPEEKPAVRLVERNGEVFVFNWPIESKVELGTLILSASSTVRPFKLIGDMLEPDESAGIGGRWTSITDEKVAHLIRRAYEKSKEGDAERNVVDDAGQTVEDLCMEYRHAMIMRHRGGAASRTPRDSVLDSDEQDADDEADEEDDSIHGDWENDEDAEREPLVRHDDDSQADPMDLDDPHDMPLLDNRQRRSSPEGFAWVNIRYVGSPPPPRPGQGPPPPPGPGYEALGSHSASDESSADSSEASSDESEWNHFVRHEGDLARINRRLMQALTTSRFSVADESNSSSDDGESRALLSSAQRRDDSSTAAKESEEGGVGLPVRSPRSSEGGVQLPAESSSTEDDDSSGTDGDDERSDGSVDLPQVNGVHLRQRRRRRRNNAAAPAGRVDGSSTGEGSSSQERRRGQGEAAAAGRIFDYGTITNTGHGLHRRRGMESAARSGTAPGTSPGTGIGSQQRGMHSSPDSGTGDGTDDSRGRLDSAVAGTGDGARDDKLDITNLTMYDLGH
ncbi:hypothetical protein IWZ00DRAFT_148165 [Phyllosticta capitalensis]